MTQAEIEAALQAAFGQCELAGFPLSVQQKEILLRLASDLMQNSDGNSTIADPAIAQASSNSDSSTSDASKDASNNPLDELTPDQRQTLLKFIQDQNRQNLSWKAQLLNDWLQGQESGSMQFIRELYGPQWLDRVEPVHIAQYSDDIELRIKVGDRIEVSNNLWEWVQDEGPCSREWVLCTVVGITETPDNMPMVPNSYRGYTNCVVRFDSGVEYEIQGVYEWNRYNWRWPES